MRLMAGIEKPTPGRDLARRQGRHRCARAAAQCLHGLPAIHQLPVLTGLREHRLAAARAPAWRTSEDQARGSARRRSCCGSTPMLDRTPAELSGGQQQRTAIARALVKDARSDAARRAAGQSRLQAARGTARRIAEAFRRAGTPSSSMPRPSPPRRCCSAATRRPCTKAASPSSDPRRKFTASPIRPRLGAGLLRSADQHRQGRARRATRLQLSHGDVSWPVGRWRRNSFPTATTASACSPTTSCRRSPETSGPPVGPGAGDRDFGIRELRAYRSWAARPGYRNPTASHPPPGRSNMADLPCRCLPRPVLRRGRKAGVLMAKITIDNLRHSYMPEPKRDEDFALKHVASRLGRRRRLCAARPLGLRQDHAAQSHLGPASRPREGRILFDGRDVTRRCRRKHATSPRCSSSR